MNKITVKNIDISITGISEDDYLSLTDLAKIKNPEFPADVIKNWMRLRSTIEFIGLWEQINNTDFNMVEFDQFKNEEMPNDVIRHWLIRVNTLNYLYLWETMNNPDFKPADFGGFESKPGENALSFLFSNQFYFSQYLVNESTS